MIPKAPSLFNILWFSVRYVLSQAVWSIIQMGNALDWELHSYGDSPHSSSPVKAGVWKDCEVQIKS